MSLCGEIFVTFTHALKFKLTIIICEGSDVKKKKVLIIRMLFTSTPVIIGFANRNRIGVVRPIFSKYMQPKR